MTDALALVPLADLREKALIALKSGLLPESIKSPEAALTIAMRGSELGMSPMQAFASIYVVKGKPSLSSQSMLALALQRIPGLQVNWIETTPTKAVVEIVRPPSKAFVSEFTMEDAKAAGVTGNGTWRAYPREMLRWRALSSGLRVTCPDILQGMYSVEELQDAPPLASLPSAPATEKPKPVVVVAKQVNAAGTRADVLRLFANGGKAEIGRVLAETGKADEVKGKPVKEWSDEIMDIVWRHAGPLGNEPIPSKAPVVVVDPVTIPAGSTDEAKFDSDIPF